MMKRLEDMMAAVSFAEEGDAEGAREMLRGRNAILLAISDVCFDTSVLKYALNLGKRVQAGIDILYLTRVEAHIDQIRDFMQTVCKEGIACRLTKTEGCMKKAILEYTDKRREIIFVVVGSTPELDIECRSAERSLSDAWKRLQCPLVVVAKSDMPSMA